MPSNSAPLSNYIPPVRPDSSLEEQLARTLVNIPPIIRLPKAGTRCPYTQLSRTGLSELVTPTARNGGRPPVKARYQRAHPHAVRGVWLIPAETLFRYILGLGSLPVGVGQGAHAPRVGCLEQHLPSSPTEIGNMHLN